MVDSPTLAPDSAEIAHVLFLDIVGYSKESTNSQSRLLSQLNELVSQTPTFARAREVKTVLPLPTGDGMALIFFHEVSAPACCATEIARALKVHPLAIRMGIHSGLVRRQADIAGNPNVAGEGINTAQRVMDVGDAGHILLSSQYANWLKQFDEWSPFIREGWHTTGKHGQAITVQNLVGDEFGRADSPSRLVTAVKTAAPTSGKMRIVLLYKRRAQPDEQILTRLEEYLKFHNHDVFIDRHLKIGVEWARAIENRIRSADAVIVIVSDTSIGSEMLEYEVDAAFDEQKKRGKPLILPIRVGSDKPIEGTIGSILNPLNFMVWNDAGDDVRVFTAITSALAEPPELLSDNLEPVGGAVPLDSPFYIVRPTDHEFLTAIQHTESIVLIKAPRQMGKTSLLGRGVKLANELGRRWAMLDFQKLNSVQLSNEEVFYRLLAATLAKQYKFDYDFANEWIDVFGPNMNLDNFMRALLESSNLPCVWFMDEADKLFGSPFASDFFGLVRSWHNSRATEPGGLWHRLTVVISYATEAHLFIQNLNQSPFNVGRQIALESFTVDQTADLNRRYGLPLKSEDLVRQLQELVEGQPFLTRRALDVLKRGVMSFPELMERADHDDGPFGDHLKRILVSVSQLPNVLNAVQTPMDSAELLETDAYYRLLAAGVIVSSNDGKIRFRCELYRRYLDGHLKASQAVTA